jgi:hypothetical protein
LTVRSRCSTPLGKSSVSPSGTNGVAIAATAVATSKRRWRWRSRRVALRLSTPAANVLTLQLFTPLSQGRHPTITAPAGRRLSIRAMNERRIETIRRQIRLAFMAAVTVAMLALTLQYARRGLPALPTTVVYALTVGFGLEFLGSAWKDRAVR